MSEQTNEPAPKFKPIPRAQLDVRRLEQSEAMVAAVDEAQRIGFAWPCRDAQALAKFGECWSDRLVVQAHLTRDERIAQPNTQYWLVVVPADGRDILVGSHTLRAPNEIPPRCILVIGATMAQYEALRVGGVPALLDRALDDKRAAGWVE